jgi:16S rRNA (guanine966-N2)-methyltransferase
MPKQLRITTGKAKNKKLKAPKIRNFRAVQEVAKQSLFSTLGEKVVDAVCLDLFAGSGNLGIEALSRGATWCDFVDEHKAAVNVIRENLKNCALEDNATDYREDAVKYAANTDKKYDLIFVDPFYEDTSHVFLMKNLEEILNEKGIIAFFHGKNLNMEKLTLDTNLEIIDERRFGNSYFTVLKRNTVPLTQL